MNIFDTIGELQREVAELKRRNRNRKRTGKIVEVDAPKGVARVELLEKGAGGKPYKTAWIPWKEVRQGDVATFNPPSVGEQVEVVSENGDLTDAVIDASIPSNANPRPHNVAGEPVRTSAKGAFREHIDGSGVQTTKAKDIISNAQDIVFTADGGGHLK